MVFPPTASAQSVWELTPYKIRLIVAMQPTAGLDSRLQADLEAALLGRFETVIGAAWDVSTETASPQLRHQIVGDIAAVTAELLPKDHDEFDKIMLLAVTTGPMGYRVAAREFDVRTQVFGLVAEQDVAQSAKLCSAAFDAVWRAFAPLATITSSKGKDVDLRLRAGGLSMRDKTLKALRMGEVFRPIVRYLDREGKIRRVMEVPWTFLVVDKIGERGFHCKLHSAMYSPLSGRRRGRVEQLALAVRPAGKSTSLTLKARIEPKQLLCGYDVLARLPDEEKTTPVGRTDSKGTVEIPATGQILRVLEVRRGGVLLARLPIVAGLSPSLTAEVPGVDERLEIEGFVTGMQERLIDIVTRREVLIARARRHIDAADWKEADACIKELRSLQTRAEFSRALEQQQEKVDVKDNWTKKKIDTLFLDTRKLLDKFLGPEAIEKIAIEVTQAKAENRPAKSQTPKPAAAPGAKPAGEKSQAAGSKPAAVEAKPAEKAAIPAADTGGSKDVGSSDPFD
ncbi:MAG: hypothetical protein JXM70_25960 [Pirellulales bacterium]|nr:hypothetical protein [Pirellulales bacterium]